VCLPPNVEFDAICHHQKFYHAAFFLSTYHYHIPKFAYAKLLTSNSNVTGTNSRKKFNI
jgi:hypothetical protein